LNFHLLTGKRAKIKGLKKIIQILFVISGLAVQIRPWAPAKKGLSFWISPFSITKQANL
jgi:hypothetical protein